MCPDFKGAVLLCASHSYSYMIDNVILLITGTLHQRSIAELVPKCHPLGSFEQMEAVNIASDSVLLVFMAFYLIMCKHYFFFLLDTAVTGNFINTLNM